MSRPAGTRPPASRGGGDSARSPALHDDAQFLRFAATGRGSYAGTAITGGCCRSWSTGARSSLRSPRAAQDPGRPPRAIAATYRPRPRAGQHCQADQTPRRTGTRKVTPQPVWFLGDLPADRRGRYCPPGRGGTSCPLTNPWTTPGPARVRRPFTGCRALVSVPDRKSSEVRGRSSPSAPTPAAPGPPCTPAAG